MRTWAAAVVGLLAVGCGSSAVLNPDAGPDEITGDLNLGALGSLDGGTDPLMPFTTPLVDSIEFAFTSNHVDLFAYPNVTLIAAQLQAEPPDAGYTFAEIGTAKLLLEPGDVQLAHLTEADAGAVSFVMDEVPNLAPYALDGGLIYTFTGATPGGIAGDYRLVLTFHGSH